MTTATPERARRGPALRSTGHPDVRKGWPVNGDTGATDDLEAIRVGLENLNKQVERANALQASADQAAKDADEARKKYHDAIRAAMTNKRAAPIDIRRTAEIAKSTLYWLTNEDPRAGR